MISIYIRQECLLYKVNKNELTIYNDEARNHAISI